MVFPRFVQQEDPEVAAERAIDNANGVKKISAPVPIEKTDDVDVKSTNGSVKSASFKEAKASRKKRSRGVSGSSIKKDGGKFDLGMENFDTFDDVSDQEDSHDYRDYEKYVSDHYSAKSAGIGSDSEDSSSCPVSKDFASSKVSPLVSILLNADPLNIEGVTEVLMEEHDDTGRAALLDKALVHITQQATGPVVSNQMCEMAIMSTICRLLDEGLLSKTALQAYCDNAPTFDQSIRLLSTALELAEVGAPASRGHIDKTPPVDVVKSIINDLLRVGGDVCKTATDLSNCGIPYFHAYFVHQLCIEAISTMNMDLIFFSTGALRDMLDHKTITASSINIGFARFFAGMEELEVDLPGATSLANLLVSYAINDHQLIDEDLYARCPKPKRFLVKKDSSCGKLTVLDLEEGHPVNVANYFIMEN